MIVVLDPLQRIPRKYVEDVASCFSRRQKPVSDASSLKCDADHQLLGVGSLDQGEHEAREVGKGYLCHASQLQRSTGTIVSGMGPMDDSRRSNNSPVRVAGPNKRFHAFLVLHASPHQFPAEPDVEIRVTVLCNTVRAQGEQAANTQAAHGVQDAADPVRADGGGPTAFTEHAEHGVGPRNDLPDRLLISNVAGYGMKVRVRR